MSSQIQLVGGEVRGRQQEQTDQSADQVGRVGVA